MISLFLELANYDNDTKMSRVVNTNEFKDKYISLKLGNGGSWCRMDSSFAKKYRYVTRKENGNLNLSWEANEKEIEQIQTDFNFEKSKKTSISHIKIYGTQNEMNKQSIRKDIRDFFKDSVCVVCGNSDTEIDHKNGLYNDKKVLQINDFQPLCRHCNQQKRQSIILTKKTGKRYKASNIPQLSIFGIDFIKGDESFEKNDPYAMIGTYWYDPIEFMEQIKLKFMIYNKK